MIKILKEKTDQAAAILREKNIDMWITFVRESSNIKDPSLDLIFNGNVTWESAFIFSNDGEKFALAGSMEVENIEQLEIYNVEGYLKSIKENFRNYIQKKSPKTVALNFSKNSNLADGLTHGMFLIIKDYLSGLIKDENIVSAEDIISSLRGRKSETELQLIKDSVYETENILAEVSAFIKPGKSEIEIAEFIKKKVHSNNLEFAWDEDHCPAVFTGPNASSAHSGPTNKVIEKGHLVNIDFGIKKNNYCADLQRTWYVLKDNEDKAPDEVLKGFEIIRDAIQLVADNLKPGVQGCAMDDIARNFITSKGYEEYPHGLGHQVGRKVHDGGCGLLPRWERYGNTPYLFVEKDQVYTIEPRLKVNGYGTSTLEEMVIVNEHGCEFLSTPQKELWLIK